MASDLRSSLERLELENELAKAPIEVDVKYEVSAVVGKALDLGGVEGNKALVE